MYFLNSKTKRCHFIKVWVRIVHGQGVMIEGGQRVPLRQALSFTITGSEQNRTSIILTRQYPSGSDHTGSPA